MIDLYLITAYLEVQTQALSQAVDVQCGYRCMIEWLLMHARMSGYSGLSQQALKSVQGTAIPASFAQSGACNSHCFHTFSSSATSLRLAAAIIAAGTVLPGRLTRPQWVCETTSAQITYCSILSHK